MKHCLLLLRLLCFRYLVQICSAEAMNTRFHLFLCLQNNLQLSAVQYLLEGQDGLFTLLLALLVCTYQEDEAISLVLYLLLGNTLLDVLLHHFPVFCFDIVIFLSHERSFATSKSSDYDRHCQ